MGIKRCPNCGSTRLLARKVTGVQVESTENGEFAIKAEGSKYQLEIIGCARCKTEFDESSLIEMVQCKKCGKPVSPEELDANGECEVCKALEERPDLVNMSKEDIIRMMLKLERSTDKSVPKQTEQQPTNTTTSTTAKEKMKAAQEAITNASNEFSQEMVKEVKEELKEENVDDMQQAMTPPIENEGNVEQETDKPKRGRKPRKKSETVEEQTNTEEVSEEQINESANEIADSQEAPFPEQDNEMKEAFNNVPEQQEEVQEATVPEQSPFQMFDNEQSF